MGAAEVGATGMGAGGMGAGGMGAAPTAASACRCGPPPTSACQIRPAWRSSEPASWSSPTCWSEICGGWSWANGLRSLLGRHRGERVFEVDVGGADGGLGPGVHQEGHETLGGVRVGRGLEHGGARDVHQPAEVATGEVVDPAGGLGGTLLGLEAGPVVVVDDAGRDRTAVDGGDHALVVVEHLGVGLEAAEPGEGGGLALEGHHGAHQGQEVGVAGGDGDAALPLGLARSSTEAGSLSSPIIPGLKATTLSRASTPTQSPVGALYFRGTPASVAGRSGASRPRSSSRTSSGEFSVK